MTIYLKRVVFNPHATFGVLYDDTNTPLCLILERPWLDNQPDLSSIPTGTYQVSAYSSPAHPNVWELQNVPNRTSILIHNGNTEADSSGCLICGQSFGSLNGLPAVLNSNAALTYLRGVLPDSFELQISQA